MYINDLENELMQNGADCIDLGMLKLCLLLYVDDIVIFSNTSDDLQRGLDILSDYCQKWKLTVNFEEKKRNNKDYDFSKGRKFTKKLVFNFSR